MEKLRLVDADTLLLRLEEAARRAPEDKKRKWRKGRNKHEE